MTFNSGSHRCLIRLDTRFQHAAEPQSANKQMKEYVKSYCLLYFICACLQGKAMFVVSVSWTFQTGGEYIIGTSLQTLQKETLKKASWTDVSNPIQ